MKKPHFIKQSIKTVNVLFLALSISLLTGCEESETDQTAAAAKTETTEAPSVLNSGLTSKTGSTFGDIGNGVNLQPSYYNSGNCDLGWNLMKQNTKIKTVRIEVEPGQETNAKRWISEAKSNGFTVIVSYHKSSVLGSDSTSELNAAATWWKNYYSYLGGNFIINLTNEWGSHNITPSAYASAYNTAITEVRKVYSGTIIIDIPGWGQETATAACAVKGCSTGQTKINDTKIILSAHIYPGAYNQAKGRYMNTSDIDDLASSGRQCMIGEFGNSGGSGADWSGIVDYAKNKGWTVLGWAWNGDGGSMNMITPQFQSYTSGSAKTYYKSSYFDIVYNKL
ncbi:glycoside hydrolase family 5 protein [Flavobacterium soyae]|uniref:glycoside hydrolase family 5 protein n=1 Tax=Flavobacterium soyae TaxID=2903098 RepID=UPI001E4F650B|nr:glycoside hydrolase family 5 protein [Flavobacterium soyae]MCD9576243.1 glycoside hydrolase family 5 protein [Flavobacterium soyae]